MTAIPIQDETHWHSLRNKHIGGTEVSCLFDMSPYMSRFELWHHKKGHLPPRDFSDNDRVFWGKTLEPAIAAGVAEKMGWSVKKCDVYYSSDACPGLGSSIDYEIVDEERGNGILEIKTVDYITFKEWEDGEPPINYELQWQAQAATSGLTWGAIGVLIGGNQLKIYPYNARPKTISKIESEVSSFWNSIKNNQEPTPNFDIDYDTVTKLYQTGGAGWINLSGNLRAEELCNKYTDLGPKISEMTKQKKAARAELLTMLGTYDTAQCGQYKISTTVVDDAEISYEREAYRSMRVGKVRVKK